MLECNVILYDMCVVSQCGNGVYNIKTKLKPGAYANKRITLVYSYLNSRIEKVVIIGDVFIEFELPLNNHYCYEILFKDADGEIIEVSDTDPIGDIYNGVKFCTKPKAPSDCPSY